MLIVFVVMVQVSNGKPIHLQILNIIFFSVKDYVTSNLQVMISTEPNRNVLNFNYYLNYYYYYYYDYNDYNKTKQKNKKIKKTTRLEIVV